MWSEVIEKTWRNIFFSVSFRVRMQKNEGLVVLLQRTKQFTNCIFFIFKWLNGYTLNSETAKVARCVELVRRGKGLTTSRRKYTSSPGLVFLGGSKLLNILWTESQNKSVNFSGRRAHLGATQTDRRTEGRFNRRLPLMNAAALAG